MANEYFYKVQVFEHARINGKVVSTDEVETFVLQAPSSNEAIKRVAQGLKEDGTYTGLQNFLAPRITLKKARELAEAGCRVWCAL